MFRSIQKVALVILFSIFLCPFVKAVDLKESNLPIMLINTNGKRIVDEPKIKAGMTIFWDIEGMNNLSASRIHYDGFIGIELRGNSSQSWPKKPYKIETRDADGENLNFSLIGLPKENDWVLHAPYVDKTLLRNALIYRLLNEMGWYAPRYRYCELVINNDYKGVYLLVESLKIDNDRIDLAPTIDNDITGGYLLELTTSNRLSKGEPYLISDIAEQVMGIKYPKDEELTAEHTEYITNYIDDFEKALYNKHFSGDQDYKNYIDVPSFIDHMLVSEVFRQLDAFCASHHFYKDAQGKLVMGPGWDYNRSIGNYKGHDTWKTYGFWLTSSRGGCKPFWPEHIYADNSFMTAYKARYAELRDNVLSARHINAIIDEYSAYLDTPKDRNFEIWDIEESRSHKYVQGSYDGEIDYVKNWLDDRFEWLDNKWDIIEKPIINEIFANVDGQGTQWVELYNPYGSTIKLNDWKLVVNDEAFTFPSGASIAAKGYCVVTNDKVKFLENHAGVSSVFEGLKGDLKNDDSRLQLYYDETMMTELRVSASEGFPMVSKSGSYAVALRPIASNNTIGQSWNWSTKEGGTPGSKNEVYDYEGLLITEIMSANNQTIDDEYDEYDDWMELTNTSNYTISLNGLFLSDKFENYGKWQFVDSLKPQNMILTPGKSVIVWLDSDAENQGSLHTNFSVQSMGERVILSYYDGYHYTLIDQVSLPALGPDQSYQLSASDNKSWSISDSPNPGRLQDGTYLDEHIFASQLKLYPNPVQRDFNLDFYLNSSQSISVDLFDYSARHIMSLLHMTDLNTGHYNYSLRLKEGLPEGLYVLQIRGEGFIVNKKLLVANQ